MKNFKLNVMEQMLSCERVYQNLNMTKATRLPLNANAGDPKSQKKIRDYFTKQYSDETQNFIVAKKVIDKVFPNNYRDMDRDIFFKKKVAREYLALPFSSIWIEGEHKQDNATRAVTEPLLVVTTEKGAYLIIGVLIHEHDDGYYISCLMTNERNYSAPKEEWGDFELIHYSCIIKHEQVENGTFDSPQEEEFYVQMHILLELVTKHKKIAYIHYNKGRKMKTPKGVKKIHVNKVIGVCLKEDGVKIVNDLSCKHIEFSHQFPCMAHWRYYPNNPELEGKDPKGNRNQKGRTWVESCIKGKEKLKKKGQIRYVSEYERTHGKMPPSEVV